MARLTPEEQHLAIEAAFRELEIKRPDDPQKLSYESLIPSIPRQLLVERGNVRPTAPVSPEVAKMWDAIDILRRHTEPASNRATRRELVVLKRQAEALLKALNALHKPAIDALNFRREALIGGGGLKARLQILIVAAAAAEVPALPANAGRGRRINTQARKMALEVAKHYFGLTGEMPTVRTPIGGGKPYGPFIQLLTEIFAALDIRAGVENHARWAIKAMEQYRRNMGN